MKSDAVIKLFSVAVLVSILTSGLLTRNCLQNGAETLDSSIEKIQNAIDKKNWNEAISQSRRLETSWDKIEPIWALVINHHEIDNITSSLVKSCSYIEKTDLVNSSASLSELKAYIKHIPLMEKLTLKNIF